MLQHVLNKDSKISLREINKDSVLEVCHLSPADEQRKFVASNAVSIAQAHFQPDYAWFRAIYAEEIPVGFVMVGIDPNLNFVFLWRFMIDKKFQKLNFGKKALEIILEYVESLKNVQRVVTSYHPGEGDPSGFYKKLGFQELTKIEDLGVLGQDMKRFGEKTLELKF